MIYHQAPDCTFYLGDVRECLDAMPAGSVQAVITSPPYFGLRRYSGVEPTVWGGDPTCAHDWRPNRYYTEKSASAVTSEAFSEAGEANADRLKAARWREDSACFKCGAWLGCLGLEPTPALFIEHLVDVFRGIRRVLRDDGVIFCNLGDSYASSPVGRFNGGSELLKGRNLDGHIESGSLDKASVGIAPKNLLLIPQRFAIAMQDDGWIVRSMIVWAKRACMPESVTDRPTSAHEVIWMFTKRERYFWDNLATRETAVSDHASGNGYKRDARLTYEGRGQDSPWEPTAARNLRNVWLDPDDRGSDFWLLGPEPFPGAHFAVFPSSIPRRCILAATSEAGCCSECGKPWERVIERGNFVSTGGRNGAPHTKQYGRRMIDNDTDLHAAPNETGAAFGTWERSTLGFHPSCQCSAPAVPCVVLDPFLGSGTTAVVARELGRRAIGIDASEEYMRMAVKRLEGQTPSMLAPSDSLASYDTTGRVRQDSPERSLLPGFGNLERA